MRVNIFEAIGSGSLEIVSRDINEGANVNLADVDGDTPLHHVIVNLANGEHTIAPVALSIMQKLIDSGAETDVRGRNHLAHLHFATGAVDSRLPLAIVKLLLSNVAAVGGESGYNSLHFAVTGSGGDDNIHDFSSELVQELIAHGGAHVNGRTTGGNTVATCNLRCSY